MSQPYVGEIKMFAGNFAPRGYALCNGQLLSISQNTALFSILGTTYGGDGRVTFGLPNLQGSVPMGKGNGNGLTPRSLGEQSGTPTVTLNLNQLPAHNHSLQCNTTSGSSTTPTNGTFGGGARGDLPFYAPSSPFSPVSMAVGAIGMTGSGQPHNNMQPYVAITFLIALQGVFPPRN